MGTMGGKVGENHVDASREAFQVRFRDQPGTLVAARTVTHPDQASSPSVAGETQPGNISDLTTGTIRARRNRVPGIGPFGRYVYPPATWAISSIQTTRSAVES